MFLVGNPTIFKLKSWQWRSEMEETKKDNSNMNGWENEKVCFGLGWVVNHIEFEWGFESVMVMWPCKPRQAVCLAFWDSLSHTRPFEQKKTNTNKH